MVSLIMSNPVFREIYEEFFKILPTDTLTQHANDSHEMSSLIIFEKKIKNYFTALLLEILVL